MIPSYDLMFYLLQHLWKLFVMTVRRVKREVRPLFLPHLVHIAGMFSPAIHTVTWVDPQWQNIIIKTTDAVHQLDILITR